LCTKGIKITVVCPGPIETPQSSAAASSVQSHSSERRVSVERCVELTIIAATHGLKEAWISYQPVLTVMYLVQYMPTIGYWLMDKVGAKRLDAAAKKGNTYSWNLIFGGKKTAWSSCPSLLLPGIFQHSKLHESLVCLYTKKVKLKRNIASIAGFSWKMDSCVKCYDTVRYG